MIYKNKKPFLLLIINSMFKLKKKNKLQQFNKKKFNVF